MQSFQIPQTTSVTEEQIDDIMTTALEGGITYWAAGCVVKDHPETGEIHWASEVISKGGTVKILDREEGKWLTLNRDQFLKGLAKAEIDLENYDAADADRVIQLAIFGKLIYS